MHSLMHAKISMRGLIQLALSSFILLGFSQNSLAQEKPFFLVEYMKVKPGMNEKYLESESKHWKPVHQERVKDGTILDWALYRIAHPSGTGTEYDYVTVTVFPNYAKMESPMNLDHFKTAHPNGNPEQMMEQTGNSRNLVKRLVVEGIDFLPVENNTPAKYAQVDYMKVPEGGEQTYIEIETSIWKKMHQARQKAGKIKSWGIYSVRYPYGTKEPYNFTTVNFMSTWKQTGMGIDIEDAKAAGLTEDQQEIMKKTLEARSLVSSELWVRVDGIN